MKFDYNAINGITNESFLKGNGENLKKVCEETANYYSNGDLEKFCEKARKVIEIILIYLHKRVTKKGYSPKMIGGIINDQEFVVKLSNEKIIRLADRINSISSKYNHAPEEKKYYEEQSAELDRYRVDQVVPQDAKEIIEALPQFLRITTEYINQIKPERKVIHLSVVAQEDKKSGILRNVLKADLDVGYSNKNCKFNWSIVGGEQLNCRSNTLYLKKIFIGKTIVCRAINCNTDDIFSGKYTVKESDFTLNGNENKRTNSRTNLGTNSGKYSGGRKASNSGVPKVEEPPRKRDLSEEEPLLTVSRTNSGKYSGGRKTSNSRVPNVAEPPRKRDLSEGEPLLTVSFLEAELAKELLKTQEDYDAEG